MARHRIVEEDCLRALEATRGLWSEVAGRRIFITGGSGFFGSWFLELLTYAADTLCFDCEIVLLTRRPDAFLAGPAKHLAGHRCVRLWEGDVMDFVFPSGSFAFVAHFGSTGPKAFSESNPEGFFDLIVTGTKRVLAFAEQAGAHRLVLASSGAVYGTSTDGLIRGVSEEYGGGPDVTNPVSVNAEGKRVAEFLSACWASRSPERAVGIARGFAFIGPYLPTAAGFAASDFLHALRAGEDIVIKGDGTPVRSYLYGSDLAVWLWTILLRTPVGTARAWNVGGEDPVTIRALAEHASALTGRSAVKVMGTPVPGRRPHIYLPSTTRARTELGLVQSVPLTEALRRTLAWLETIPKIAIASA